MTFPSRVKRAGDLRGTQLQQGHLEIPDDFDFSFFQAAPPDQRLDMLAGDEWIVLEGFHESGPFRTRLPGAQAEARIYGGQAQGLAETLALRLDMVQIDANSGVCALVWRGNFRAPAALDALGVGVTVSPPGQPAAWPATFEALVAAGGAGGGRADDGDDDSFGDDDPIGGTMRIRLDKAAPALPFRRSVPPNTPPPPPVRGQPEADDENPFEQTMTLEAFQRALPASPASPFQLAAPKAAAPAPPIPGSPWARQAAPASQARPVPGAPWSHEPATPVVARATPRTMLRGEAALGGVAPPAPVVAPPPVVAREHAASEQAQRAAEQQAKLEAERQAKVAAEEQARLAAEQQAKLAAEEKAMVEAEARRLEAAERFRKEQELAREAADRRVADAAKAKRDDAAKLRQAIYSSIRQRKK